MIRVVAAILEQRGRLLICQRRRGDAFGLKWEFPGGKLRPGETPREGLRRELREELGVGVCVGPEVFRTRHCYSNLATGVEIVFYAAARPFPYPRNIVFERILWVWPADLQHHDFLEADRKLVAQLARGEFSSTTIPCGRR